MSVKIDYTKIINVGDKNENLIVIDVPFRKFGSSFSKKSGEWHVKVRCNCGKEQYVTCARWIRKEYKKCRGCQLVGKENYAWNGYGDINGQVFCKIRLNAKRIGVEYKISKKYLWELFLKQNKMCALSGMDLKFRFNNGEQTASLDRIDSSKGYIEGNVQWIHKTINIMKNGFKQEDFLRFCKMIYECNRDRIQGPIENISNRRDV